MKSFRMNAVYVACCTALFGLNCISALAADEPKEKKPVKDAIEVIEVRGISSSLKKSINAKRFADSISDVISAEDIGKFPDDNLADSLQRVTGVTVTRESGEGATVSVRGLDAGLTNVTVNGQGQASGSGTGREFSFNVLASEHVKSLEVIKSPTADMEEGGVGATINVKTRKALDFNKTVFSFNTGIEYTELADKVDPRFSSLWAMQNSDKDFGAVLTLNHTDRTYREDALRGWGFREEVVTAADGLVEGGEVGDEYAYLARLRQESRLKENTRTGGTLSLQWLPTSDIELHFDALYSRTSVERRDSYLETILPINFNPAQKKFVIIDGSDQTRINENGTLVAGKMDRVKVFAGSFNELRENELLDLTLGGIWEIDDQWTMGVDASISSAENRVPENISQRTESDTAFQVDYLLQGRFPDFTYYQNKDYDTEVNPGNSSLYTGKKFSVFRRQLYEIENDKTAFKLDLERNLAGNFFSDLKFGVRFSKQNKSRTKQNYNLKKKVPEVNTFFTDEVTDYLDGSDANVSSINWNVVNVDGLVESIGGIDAVPVKADNNFINYDVEEKTSAGYIRVDFDSELPNKMPIKGNLGVRYVKTNIESLGSIIGDADGLRTTENSYDDTLPSLNVSIGLNDETLVRAAVAKVMSRPKLVDLSAQRLVNDEDDGNYYFRQGNPELKPYRATSYDLSFEWYFNESSLFSVAYFYKDIESFIFTTIETTPIDDEFELTIREPVNGAGATVEGVEVAFQHIFDYLPEPFNGLGVNTNYTYQKSDADFGTAGLDGNFSLPGLSDHSYNVAVFYEKEGFSTRFAYNYRSEYLHAPEGRLGALVYGDDFGQLDGSISYDINKHFTITLDAINITEEEQKQYDQFEERLYENYVHGRRFSLGMRFRY